jgi:mRNA interferase MazF
VCVSLTSNTVWAGAPGNVLLASKATGLPKDSVANVSQIVALDRSLLSERVGRLGPKARAQILHGIDVVLGR